MPLTRSSGCGGFTMNRRRKKALPMSRQSLVYSCPIHFLRDARNSSTNSSMGIPSTALDLSSSPRRIASMRLFSSKSFGSAPSRLSTMSATSSSLSPGSSFSASAVISFNVIGKRCQNPCGLQRASRPQGISDTTKFSGNFQPSPASSLPDSYLASLASWRFPSLS